MKFLIKVGVCAGIFLSTVSFVMAGCIGVVTAGGGQRYWSEVKKGAELAGKELGVDIYARGAVNEGDIEGQRLVIEEIKKLRCLGLLLAPNSEERKRDVTQLKFLGIPTVYIDRDIGGDRISVIQTDNFLAGELAGTEMAKALKGKGKVAVFRPDKSVVTTTAREKGFITAAVKGGLEIVIDSYVGSAVGIARGNAFNILQEATDIDGIFTPNESTSVAVLATLQSLKKAGEVIHIGFDSNNYLIHQQVFFCLKSG